jgi:hypothetical protein
VYDLDRDLDRDLELPEPLDTDLSRVMFFAYGDNDRLRERE